MRLITIIAALCVSLAAWSDEWAYDGPIRILNPGENKGVVITESEHEQNVADHRVVRERYKVKRSRPTRFPTWFSSK